KSGMAPVTLDPSATIGLLLMRPQVVSKTTKHYDALIRAIEAEGLSVIPALSTLMDNREAVGKFFIETNESKVQSPKSKVESKVQSPKSKPKIKDQRPKSKDQRPKSKDQSRASAKSFP